MQELRSFIEKLKSQRRLAALDEASTKQGVVLPLLARLGWDTFNIDEVVPEYSLADKKVDYALKLAGANKVFIEVKKPSEDLERHQEQLLNYSFQEGVRLAALTNGPTWWLYLPLHEGSWEQRKFYTIDLVQQSSEDVGSRFSAFLSKVFVESGKAIENAEKIYRSRQKESLVRQALPEAWNRLVLEPDELLIELLGETREKICGHKADAGLVEVFLADNKLNLLVGELLASRTSPRKSRVARKLIRTPSKGFTGTSVKQFVFLGKKYDVDSWIGLLIKLSEVLLARHGRDFERCLSLSGRKRPYFTRKPEELRLPRKIENTAIFMETNLSANSIASVAFDLISLFGYSNQDLSIDTH